MTWILVPPIAFLIYVALVGMLTWFGRTLANETSTASEKASTYGSGEALPRTLAAPGYRPFFVIALFFAVLHLGMLVLALSGLAPMAGIYIAGLMLALMALILG